MGSTSSRPIATITMKQFLALAALLSLGALSWAQIIHPYECHCGVFVSYSVGESEVYRMQPLHLEGCDNTTACVVACADKRDALTTSGDLTTDLANGYMIVQYR